MGTLGGSLSLKWGETLVRFHRFANECTMGRTVWTKQGSCLREAKPENHPSVPPSSTSRLHKCSPKHQLFKILSVILSWRSSEEQVIKLGASRPFLASGNRKWKVTSQSDLGSRGGSLSLTHPLWVAGEPAGLSLRWKTQNKWVRDIGIFHVSDQ